MVEPSDGDNGGGDGGTWWPGAAGGGALTRKNFSFSIGRHRLQVQAGPPRRHQTLAYGLVLARGGVPGVCVCGGGEDALQPVVVSDDPPPWRH